MTPEPDPVPALSLTRRRFLGSAALAAGTPWLAACESSPPRTIGPNDTIRVAVIGLRGRGKDHIVGFSKLPGVSVAAICDVDPAVLDQRLADAKKAGAAPRAVGDPRRVFDDASIDAVVIATPNHTHTSLAILALQAGKHVFVEKPVSHDVNEGSCLVAAAKRSGRIVQSGTQNRSDTGLIGAYAALHSGELGAVRGVHGICYRDRKGIGRRGAPLPPPAGLDYDSWLGPAQDLPILRDSFHYDWHWVWNTGNGDIGNQGPHELDMMLWAMRDPGLPKEVVSVGGRFGWGDAGETPNVLVTHFRFAGDLPVCFEVRNLVPKPRTDWHGVKETGVVIVTEHGELRARRGGSEFVDRAGQSLRTWKGDSGETHAANFVAALRANDARLLRSPIELGHRAAALAHLANASYRLAKRCSLADARVACENLTGVGEHLDSIANNLKGHGIDASGPALALGVRLQFDPASERFTGAESNVANALLSCERRKGHELPAAG